MKVITSTQNDEIKDLVRLQTKSSERKKQGLFVVEGLSELTMLLENAFSIKTAYFCPSIVDEDGERLLKKLPNIDLTEVNKKVYQKIAFREKSGGIVAIAKIPTPKSLPEDNQNSLFVLLEDVEKPGNIGAIFRTAEATKTKVILSSPSFDLYNPNVIRASLGTVFELDIYLSDNKTILDWCKKNSVETIATALVDGAIDSVEIDYEKSSLIIMGNEHSGVSDFWLQNGNQKVIIPMVGKVNSLNVSVATGIMLFEAMRKRAK